MNRSLPPEPFIEKMDAVSRTRRLSDRESVALEKAIVAGKVSVREALRLGIRRDMRVYNGAAEDLQP